MATIVFAGGGTAGHIEPALAVAHAWRDKHSDDVICFIGTKNGLENTLVPAAGFKLAHIPKVSIVRKPSYSWLKFPFDLVRAVQRSRVILKSADLLFGFGGYVSAPAYIAARLTGVPIVVHEANAKPGWANRLGSYLSPYLAVAHSISSPRFSDARVTGLPLRLDVALAFRESGSDWASARDEAKKRLGFNQSAPLIFIMGGSQGSVAINTVIEGAIPLLLSQGISILHSVGSTNSLPAAVGAYRPVAYVNAMADAYLASDLIIARSGAVTCSEFRTLGRYALFVPLPIGNGEQFHNARTLVEDGRAEIIEQRNFTAKYLTTHFAELLIRSSEAPIDGSDIDLNAADRIVSLGECAITA